MSSSTRLTDSRPKSANTSRPAGGSRRLRTLGLVALGGFLLVVVLVALAPSASAQCVSAPRVFFVDDDYFVDNPLACQYKSITNLTVIGLQTGDIINIANGSYTLGYNLTADGTSWVGESQRSVFVNSTVPGAAPIVVRANLTSISNISFGGYAGVQTDTSVLRNYIRLENLTLTGSTFGCMCFGHNISLLNVTTATLYGIYYGAGSNLYVRNFNYTNTNPYYYALLLWGDGFDVSGVRVGGLISTVADVDLNAPNNRLDNVFADPVDAGFYIYGPGALSMQNITIKNASGTGMFIYDRPTVSIDGFSVTGSVSYGVYLTDYGHLTMRNFEVTRSTYGIFASSAFATADLRGFTAGNGTYGIYANGAGVNVTGLSLQFYSNYGVFAIGTARLNITGATITNATYGIYGSGASLSMELRNIVAANGTGVGLYLNAGRANATTLTLVAFSSRGVEVQGGATLQLTGASINGSFHGVHADGVATWVDLAAITANGGSGCGLSLANGGANVSGLVATNFSVSPICGSGAARLNITGLLAVGGNDNIAWSASRALVVQDALMGLPANAGINHQSGAPLTLQNVTILDAPNYGIYCSPCGPITWTGGGVNNTYYGVYPNGALRIQLSHLNFTNIAQSAVPMWWGVNNPSSFDNITVVNASSGIYIYGAADMLVADCVFVDIPYGALSIWGSTNMRLFSNTWLNASRPIEWEPDWSPGSAYNMHQIPTTNMVDGKPIRYLLNVTNYTVPANTSLVIAINSSNIQIAGLNQTAAVYGVILAFGRNVTIVDSLLVGNNAGVYSVYTDNLTVNNVTGVSPPNGWSAGIMSYYSSNLTVTNSSFFSLSSGTSGYAVGFYYGNNLVARNIFGFQLYSLLSSYQGDTIRADGLAGNTVGWAAIDLSDVGDAWISNVTASNANYAAYVWSARGVDLRDFLLINSTTYGLYFESGNVVNLTRITAVAPGGVGLYVTQTSNVTVTDSQFASGTNRGAVVNAAPYFRSTGSSFVSLNSTSLVVSGTNPNMVFFHNNFYGGAISNTGGQGTWDAGFPTGGNYYQWAVGGFTDQFTGVTKTTPGKDGLADQNYTVGGAARDFYPLMDPWPPGIVLTSPANGSVIQAGTAINFTVSNFFDTVTWADAFDGNGSGLAYPHDIDTTGWADGTHNITVTASDSVAPLASRTFTFILDSTPPNVTTTPTLGSTSVAAGTRINITVTDLHLEGTLFRIDGGPTIIGSPTYSVDTTGWSVGNHWILIVANDTAGNIFLYNWTFYIDGAAPTLSLFDPTGLVFVPPGTHFTFEAADENLLDSVTFVATPLNATAPQSGALAVNGSRYSVDTTGWADGCYGLRVTATDDAGHTAEVSQDICVDGSHPDLSGVQPTYTGAEDVPFTFPGTAVQDLDWNPTFTWEFDPSVFLALTTLTGRSPTYTFPTPASYSVHLVVVDRAGNVASKDFVVVIADTTAPTAAFPLPGNAPEDRNLTLDASNSTDNDPAWSLADDTLFTWVITGPSGTITVNGSLASVNLTEPGNHTVNLTVRDAAGLSTTLSKNILILDKTAPTISVDGVETVINEGDWVYFDASGTTDNLPGNLNFVWTFIYGGSPRTIQDVALDFQFITPGTYTITLTVTDLSANVATQPFVLRVNDVPSLVNTPLTDIQGGSAYSWQIQVLDNDTGDTLTYVLGEGPSGLQVSSTGLVQWSPAVADAGVHRVQITVDDGYGYLDIVYVVTVTRPPVAGNHPPAFTSFPVQSATPSTAYSYAVRFADPDAGDHLTLALAAGPDGMTLDNSDTLHWDVPDWFEDGDSAVVSLALSDGMVTVHQNFTIRIRLANAAAQFVTGQIPTTLEVKVGESTQVALGPGVATDADDPYGDLSFFVVVSSGNSAEASIQMINGVPTLVVSGIQGGTTTLTLRVADPSGAGQDTTITVTTPAAVTPGGGDMGGLLLLLALVAAGGVAALVLVKRRRPGDEAAVAMEPPTASAEEVQVEVVEEPKPAPAKAPAAAAAAAGAVGVGAAAAAAARAPPAAVPPAPKSSKGATYTIEGLFIIYQDGRMIFSKTDLGAEQLGDPELVSSMFTAVTQFIKDSFSAEGDLNKMGYGDNQIFIERGNHVFMAAIAFGEPDKELQEKMGTAIEKMEYSYAGVIEAWDGQTNRFDGIEKYVAPVLALTAGITRGDVLAATTTREVKVLSQLEFFQGFVRLKVGVKNDTEAVVTKVTLDIDYNEDVLRLQRIEPASYKTSGARVMLNVLNPGEKSSVAFYFDPQICTETNIDGIVRFRDYKGVLQSVTMKTRKAEVVCPLFFTKEHANTAMLKRLIETELMERDSKIYSITKIPPYVKHKDIFEICKQVVLSHDVHMVREFVTYNPFSGEAWFYGETKVKGYKIVIRTAVREDNTIEFFAASSVIKAVTGLLAEFNHTLVSMVVERYSDVKIEQIYDEGKKHEIQAKALVDKLGEGEATAGETEQ